MIKKIKTTEYLKPYGAMADGERREYQSRVGEWLSGGGRRLLELTERPMAKSQNIMLLSARWKKPEVRAFLDGALLLTALIGVADTWLPTQLYAKSAYRAVRQMVEVMEKMGKTPAAKPQGTVKAGNATGAATDGKASGSTAQQNLKPETLKPETSRSVLARPRHIDQYVHLLPEATQKKAAGYGELMRELDVARENLRIVMDDVHASDRDREQWAKKVSKLDGQIGDIRRELDREWEKVAASGKVVMDDLGMAHLVSEELRVKSEEYAAAAQGSDQEPEALKLETKTNDDQRRAALLRKWLIDTRYGNKDAEKRAKYQEKWQEKYREMVRIGGMEAVTEKVREAAKHYEIDLEKLNSEKE